MNRKPFHSERKLASMARPWWAVPTAFLATMLALPVNAAITIPTDPLSTGIRVAPNILFILDNSGSMAWNNMNNQDITKITGSGSFSDTPDANGIDTGSSKTSESTGNSAMYEQNYVTNSLYYNPAVDYAPWYDDRGDLLTGGTSYDAAYSSDHYVTFDGVDKDTAGGSKNLSSKTQTFYIPQNTASIDNTYLAKVDNYYRYQILDSGKIYRSEWLSYTSANTPATEVQKTQSDDLGTFGSTRNDTNSGNYSTTWSISVPSGATDLVISSSGGSVSGSIRGADLYTRFNNNNVTTTSNTNSSTSNGNTESITVASPSSGTWYVRMYSQTKFSGRVTVSYSYKYTDFDYSGVAAKGCDTTTSGYGWRGCTETTPDVSTDIATSGHRSADDEKINFATWYSYYRTRIKAAKAGAAEAFKSQGNKVRVGYRSLHPTNNSSISPDFDIPVKDGNDGRFVNGSTSNGDAAATTTRSKWYNRLFAAYASSGTPLRTILTDAGKYFSDTGSSTGASGPYGPETGSDQYSCRQNFTILTTDGYWNGDSASVSNADNSSGSTITGSNGQSYTYNAADPYKDSYSNTLADVAMYYWKTDLRTLTNNVPTSTSDPGFWQHMVTFTISIGLKTTKGWSSVEDVPATSPGWPDPDTSNPDNDNAKRIDDLLHAAVDGHGSFVAATSPAAFTAGLAQALAKIQQRVSSSSNGAVSSTQLNTGTLLFSAKYTSGIWTGELLAQPVSRGGLSSVSWTGAIPAFSTRKSHVFTYSGSAGTAFPTSAQSTALDRSSVGPVDYPVTGAKNADYIMGDQSGEGTATGKLRERTTLLGDIVNSSPAYASDTNTVYVGANDGMLHAFDASTGVEQFAYVPGILNFGNLAQLSRGDYEHKWFVDGPIAISQRLSTTSNKNILVGALGRGGKGVYALDVTTPGSFAASNVKWERSETTNQNMGLVLGTPILANVRNGSATAAAVFGNGPNSTSDKAVLEVLNLSDGSVIAEVPTNSSTGNGLFTPTGVYAADGTTLVYVYAGDMLGNVWKFDLRSSTPSSWSATKIFNATKSSKAQPITGGMAVAVDQKTFKRWVFFGTGSYLTAADGNDTSTSGQSMYGVMDDGGSYSRSNLTSRSVTTDSASGERYFDDKGELTSGTKGWYLDLPGIGERVVDDVQINGSFMVASSRIPSGDSCENASGSGYLNGIDAFTGTSGGKSMFDLDGDGNTDDTGTGTNKPTGSVNTGVGMPTKPVLLPGQIITCGSNGSCKSTKTFKGSWQRVSWREIRND